MKAILYILVVVTLVIAGSMIYEGVIFSSILSLLGVSILSFWAGSGLRGGLYGVVAQRLVGLVLASIFMSLAYLAATSYPFVVTIFDISLGGGIWSLVFFIVAFLGTNRKDAVLD